MKNFSFVLNVVFAIALIILYVLFFNDKSRDVRGQISEPVRTNKEVSVVYVNTDTLLMNYKLSIELNEAFLKKQENRRTELNQKAKSLDGEMREFQRKLENNGFLSRERAEAARDAILLKQQKLQQLQQDMTNQMMNEQADLNKKLFDKITSCLKEFNKEMGYDIILSTTLGGNVLFAKDGFDITSKLLEELNKDYDKRKE